MSNFYTLLTRVGAALHANAQVNQTTVPWTHMRLGDGNGAAVVPTENQTGLVRQVHTLQITDIAVHPENPNWVIAEAVVPSDVGGWTVREAAIYGGADGNTCIAVGNYPETYKPVLAEGAGREMVMRMVVEISSVATVKLQIDPAVAIASRAWVESLVATPLKAGLVKLANLQEHLDGETSSKAATPAGVHAVVGIATEQVMNEVLALKSTIGMTGQAKNLRCAATGTNALVSVTADQLFLDSAGGQTLKVRSVNLSINTAAIGANGLDAGVLAANTWYSVWVISDGVNVRGLISLSATLPTMPDGYADKARVGWIRIGAAPYKYPLAFTQNGNEVQWSLPVVVGSGAMGNVAGPVFAALSLAAAIPPTAAVYTGFTASGTVPTTVNQQSLIVAPSPNYGATMTTDNPSPLDTGWGSNEAIIRGSRSFRFLRESDNVYAATQSTGVSVRILGWEDSL